MATLNSDNDFSILRIESRNSEYIRLTHPHLCNAIYKSIRPEKAGFQRAEDLANAFDLAIQFDDVLASRILLAIAQGGERITHDLDETILAKMISKIWTRFQESVSILHPIGLAYLWTNWARWANRESTIISLFPPGGPLEKAIVTLGSDYYSWGDLWLQLWECDPGNPRLSQNAWIWVNQNHHFEEASWYFVWLSLQEHPKALPRDASLTQLLEIGINWLDGREDNWRWSFIWQSILRYNQYLPQGTSLTDILQSGFNWLNNHEDHSQWSLVWEALLQHHKHLPQGTSLTDILQSGFNWLNNHEDHSQWSLVWETLLQHHEHLPQGTSLKDLLLIGVNWLAGREDKDQWAFVWQGLIKHPESLPSTTSINQLLNVGINWLTGREDKDQWAFVWQGLIKHPESLPSTASINQLLNVGIKWLKGREDKDQWAFVWQSLLKRANNVHQSISVHDLLTAGLDWLDGHEDKDQWSFVWQVLLKQVENYPPAISVPDLLAAGFEWLKEHKEKEDWPFIWQDLVKHWNKMRESRFTDQINEIGMEWILNNQEKKTWPIFYSVYIQKTKTDISIKLQGIQWVEEHANSESASNLALIIARQFYHSLPPKEKSRFMNLAKSLVYKANIKSRDWAIRWLVYWEVAPTVETVLLALRWMEAYDRNIDGVKTIVNKLISTERLDVIKRLVHWLNGHENKSPWNIMWLGITKNYTILTSEILDELIANGFLWFIKNQNEPDALGVALEIANHDNRISESKMHFVQEWIKNWVTKTNIQDKRWLFGWRASWKTAPTIENVDLALKWIEANPQNTKGIMMVSTLLEVKRPEINDRIIKWYEKHSDHPISETIKEVLS